MHQIYIRRTLSELEAYCLQELFEICHTIMYSGYESPDELAAVIEEVAQSLKTDTQTPIISIPVAHR